MKLLIFSPNSAQVDIIARFATDCGFMVETCQNSEQLTRLLKVENYSAVMWLHPDTLAEIEDLLNLVKFQTELVVIAKSQSLYLRAKALELGVRDYYLEPCSYLRILENICIRYLHNNLLHKENLKTNYFEIDLTGRTVNFLNKPLILSKSEFNILFCLARSQGKVVGRFDIWEEIWGDAELINDNKIDVYISRIRGKLPENYRQLIKTVHGIGYRLHDQA